MKHHHTILSYLIITLFHITTAQNQGCKFFPVGENRRFERVEENLPVGHEVFRVEVYPRKEFRLEAVDNSLSDINYFRFEEINNSTVAIKLAQSLEDLVDRRDPQSVLKFKLTCRGQPGTEDAFLPITIYIQDINDHKPEFKNVPYSVEVDELTPVGLTVFRGIHAIDRDKPNTANSDITYSIVGGNENNSFILSDPIEGILVVNKPLDYDHGIREFKIQIQASDHGSPSLSAVTTITIRLKDADDQNPTFTREVYKASVSESPIITGLRIRERVVVQPSIHAYDQDTGINARLRYNIIIGNENAFFEMNEQTAELYLVKEIDLEALANSVITLQIQATQIDNPLRQALSRVDVNVIDINDNYPEFEYDMYNITVMENLPEGFTVLQVMAIDRDRNENAEFKYVIDDETDTFQINEQNGWISVKNSQKLDRETQSKFILHVSTVEKNPNIAMADGHLKRNTQCTVEVRLGDANDNNPNFYPSNHYSFNVLETADENTIVGNVYAHDKDLDLNGVVRYQKQISNPDDEHIPFDVHYENGSVYVKKEFTIGRKARQYTLFVIAEDQAIHEHERRSSVAVVKINVTDINNSVPEFVNAPYTASVGESLPEGTHVTQVHATDEDATDDVLTYSIVAGNDEKLFVIDSLSGKIMTAAVLDYEKKQSYDLLVQVSDGINTAVTPLLINVIDINDQIPTFFKSFYNFTIEEEDPDLNKTIGQMMAADSDSERNAQIKYQIIDSYANEAFTIHPTTGVLKARRTFDREQESEISFKVQASDSGTPQLSSTCDVKIFIKDINDNAVVFAQSIYTVEIEEEKPAPMDVIRLVGSDQDQNENAIIKYLILAGNEDDVFQINENTGLITTKKVLNYEQKQEYIMHIAARNIRPFEGPNAELMINPAVQLIVKVIDINDELVVFERQGYKFSVRENTPHNTIIGHVNATNPKRQSNEQDVIYWLEDNQVSLHKNVPAVENQQMNKQVMMNNDEKRKFKINRQTGEIYLVGSLDRDYPANEQFFRFKVFSRDLNSINTFNTSASIEIVTIDTNDNSPVFNNEHYTLELPESLPPGTAFPSVFQVSDLDEGMNGKIVRFLLHYLDNVNDTKSSLDDLVSGESVHNNDIFKINNMTGSITLTGTLDYETKSKHELLIIAFDGGNPANIGQARVTIFVTNINEYPPKFMSLPYIFSVQERAKVGTEVGRIVAVDDDSNKIYFSIHSSAPKNSNQPDDVDYFKIDEQTGKITVKEQLSEKTDFVFTVVASDDGLPNNYSLGVQVVVKVKDLNDFLPTFSSSNYEAEIVEKQESSSSIIQVTAYDQDLQDNMVTYSIVSGNDERIFNIDEQTGEISLVPGAGSRVNYDRKNQYVLLIKATDSSPTPLYSLTMVKILVRDQNDHPPQFDRKAYSASIPENLPPNHCFLTAQATSGDSVDEVTYSLVNSHNLLGSNLNGQNIQNHNLYESEVVYGKNKKKRILNNVFSINEKTGQICTKIPLDREQKSTYELLIAADDGKFRTVAPLVVSVSDLNDSPPIFEQQNYRITLPIDTQPGTELIQLTATDADLNNNADITYWIKNTHGLFEIDAKTGLVRLVSNIPTVMGNKNMTYSMEVFAQDHGLIPNIGKAMLNIKLSTNLKHHPPKFDKFSYLVEVDENLSNIVIVKVQASSSIGPSNKITYRIVKSTLPDYFSIDKQTGTIKLEKALDYEQTKFLELTVEAKDEIDIDSQFTTCVVQIRVRDSNDNAPEILAMPSVLRIPESTLPISEIIYQVECVDLDSSYNNNNLINYEFQSPSAFFAISKMTGQIYANQSLTPLSENLVIICSDNGSPPLATIKEIKLVVYKDTIDQPTPIFSASQYTYDLENAIEPGNVILRVKAKIPNGSSVYYNISSDPTGQFVIDPSTGALSVLTKLDPESVNNNVLSPFNKPSLSNYLSRSQVFSFIVNAYNKEDPFFTSESSVVVKMVDSSIKCPKFPFTQYYSTIEENSPINTVVLNDLLIEDYRKFDMQQLTYQITEDNSNDNFYIDVFNEKHSSNGSTYVNLINQSANKMSVSLKIKKSIDRDSMSKFLHGIYTLVVTASNVKCSSRTMIKILVRDLNDNSPIFNEQNYFTQLRENTPVGTVVTRVNATDKDELDYNKLRYYIVDGNEKQMFRINENSGVISLLAIPDRELVNYYQMRLVAVDTANNTGFCNLNIEILGNLNDNSPTFVNETFFMNVTEGPSSVGTRLRLPVYDLDDGENRQMEVYIVDGNSNGEFRLDVDEGGPILTVIAELDREKYAESALMNSLMQSSLLGKHGSFALHQVLIGAKDAGIPSRVGKTQVNLIINDINDTPPKFKKESYMAFLTEDAKPDTIVCEIEATDADSHEKTQLTYNFGKMIGNTQIPFKIDPVTGTVNVSRPLDISEAEQYNLIVEVFDGLWKSATNLKIFISEAEERNPRFGQTYYHFNVMENEPSALVGRVELKPRKSRINSLMQYVIVNVEMRNLFSINSNGEIYTKKSLDREKRSQYSFTVMLEEKRPSTKITIAEVIINVSDQNDETPVFAHNYKGTIKENSPPGSQVLLRPENIRAIDNDAGNNSIVHYSLSGEGSDYFTVLDSGSVLYTPKSEQQILDREQNQKFDLVITATDHGNLSSTTSLVIQLEDENDNPPVFQHGPLFILIPEIAKPGTKIGSVLATDADDVGLNSKIQYYITSGSNGYQDGIKIDRVSGELFVVGNLVPLTNYLLNISAVDGGGLASRVSVNITIVDVNDHRPIFDQFTYQFDTQEGNYTQNKIKLGVLRARDEDYGKNGLVEYTLASSVAVEFPFSIDVHTGELFASGFIDREHKDLYKFQITAIDNGEPPLNSTADVLVRIRDVNDNKPKFYTDPYLAHVPENMEAGFKVTQIAAFDSDLGENGQVFYKLGEGADNKFYIDGKDGTVWTLGPLDFETKSFYNITVIAYDKGTPSLSSAAKLWVTVSDVPDAVPDFPKAVYTIEVAESAPIDQTVYQLDAGVGAKKYVLVAEEHKVIESNYELGKQATFAIDRNTGEVKLKKKLDSTQKNHYKLIVRAEDDSEPPKSDTAEINVFIGTGQGVRLFSERIYKVSIYENQLAPSLLIDLNSTNEIIHRPVYYSLIGTNYDDLFKIEHDSGRLIVTRSLDREQKSSYKLKIRENYVNERHKRAVPVNEKYVNSFNEHLAFDEALVVVDVLDENDSIPKFSNGNSPIVAAVPLEASFGYLVTKAVAHDMDVAQNSMIKYEMISKNDDSSKAKFYVDPSTGNIRSIVNFAMDANKYYHFEVKATDRNGDPNGNSAVISVYVYVLPETKMVLFVTDSEPVKIENKREEILKYLSHLTKYDVRLAKITPHLEQGVQQFHSTDMYLYAVNPRTNEIVDIDQLLNIFRESSHQILDQLKDYRIRRIQGVTVHEKISQMGTTEIAIIGLSTIIFLGTIIAILLLCSSCKERKLRKEQMAWEHQRLFQVKNAAYMEKQPVANNLYGNRDLSNGNSNCTYSTEDGNGSEYFNNLAQFKRNDIIGKSRLEGRQIPPDGASSLNQSRSPRFSDRYKHRFGASEQVAQSQGEWFDHPKEPVPSRMSRHSRASGRSVNSGTSWSGGSSEERNFATEL